MKLRKIYESILTEIGDSAQVPPGTEFGNRGIKFNFEGLTFIISINKLIENDNKLAISVDFKTIGGDHEMTNQNQPLKLMGFIVGSIFEWLNKYSLNNQLIYIKYNPKSESDETKVIGNKRDRLYRMFIEKFAKRYNSDVTFSTAGGIIAQFKPPIEIK